jgi:outer membrane protein, heavy metal efflux system
MRIEGRRAGTAGVLMLACCLNLALGSEIPSVLGLEEAVALAVARNPVLQAATNDIEIEEAEVVERRQRLNPSFTFDVEDYPYFSSNAGPFFQQSEITARFDYEVETRGRRGIRTEVAQQAADVRKTMYRDRVRGLRLAVQQAFYRVVLAKSNLEVAESILDQTGEVIALNQVRLQQGEISELELRRIEVEQLRFVDEKFNAELELRNAKSELLSLMNAPDLDQEFDVSGILAVDPNLPEPGLPPAVPLARLSTFAREHRPDLAAAAQQEQLSDTETRLQKAIRSPNLTLGGGYKRNGPDNSLVFGVSVPLRVFNRNQGGMLRAAAEQRRAANISAAVRNRIELEIRQAHNAVEINRQRVQYIETEQLDKARQMREVTLAAYRLGGGTLMDYLDAQRSYIGTVRIYNRALHDRRLSLYVLANALGVGGEK